MNQKLYRWNGKIVSKAVYNQRVAQVAGGRGVKRVSNDSGNKRKILRTYKKENDETVEFKTPGEGRRIVELIFLGQQLWCTSCKECLSLDNIENEYRGGLGSMLYVRCHKCLLINPITTGKQHSVVGVAVRNTRYDVNTKLVMGKNLFEYYSKS